MMEQAKEPAMSSMGLAAEFDRLYLEKCEEVNKLERKVESLRDSIKLAMDGRKKLRAELEELKGRTEAQGGDLISREKVLEAIAEGRRIAVAFPDNVSMYDMDTIISGYNARHEKTLELIKAIPAAPDATATIRELAGERFKPDFIPNVEAPEKLPEALEKLPMWAGRTVSTQDILCLSSALKNLYDIHKCDGWILYNKLCKVLEETIEGYCRKE